MERKSTTPTHVEFDPPEGLEDAIRCIWVDRRDFGAAPAAFAILPDGCAEIVFCTGDVALAGRHGPLPSPFIMGMLDAPVVLRVQGRMDVLGIRCFPWTVFDLLGLDASADAVRLFEHPIGALQPVVAACLQAGLADEAVGHVRRHLEAAAPAMQDAVLRKAGAALRAAQGGVTVGGVAAAAHASTRTLERRFRQSSGRTVKDVAGAMRFEQLRNRLWTRPDSSLAALAQEFGYTDQAHLSRDFKRYTGTTPSAFARKARRDQQAAGAHHVAFRQD